MVNTANPLAYPTISIVSVVRNNADALASTIENVAAIKNENMEFIIIDGDSSDSTLDLIRANEGTVDRWISEPDSGIYDAMNKGWQFARSDAFVLYLGAGDRVLSLPTNIGQMNKHDVICGNVDMGGKEIFRPKPNFMLHVINTMHHQALLVRKSLNPTPPFNPTYRCYADFDFNQRLYKRGVRFWYTPELLSYTTLGGVSEAFDVPELLRVIRSNFGFGWTGLAIAYYACLGFKRGFTKLRSFRK